MPAYGSLQAGGVLTCLYPGDSMALWGTGSGTTFAGESPAVGTASIAFERAMGYGPADAGMTFQLSSLAAATIKVQGSNEDVDGQYQDLATVILTETTGVPPTFVGNYTDTTRWKFYRDFLVSGGTSPITAIVQR